MTSRRRIAPALLLGAVAAGCGSSGAGPGPSTTFTTVSEERVVQIVARPAATLARGLVAIVRCSRELDSCSSADQRSAQQYVLLAGELQGDLSSLRARQAVPSGLDVLVERTGAAAAGVPTASLLCGPGTSDWPASKDECTTRYRDVAEAAAKLASALHEWENVRG